MGTSEGTSSSSEKQQNSDKRRSTRTDAAALDNVSDIPNINDTGMTDSLQLSSKV